MESIKAWRIMEAGIKSIIKAQFSELPDSEIQRIFEEIKKECQSSSLEDIAGCVYRKIGELKSGKTGRV